MSKIQYLDDIKLLNLCPNGKLSDNDILILDIRSPGEYAAEYIPGSINLPLDEIASLDKNTYKDKTLIFHCKGGVRTKANQHILETLEAKTSYCLEGGIEQWKRVGFPIKK